MNRAVFLALTVAGLCGSPIRAQTPATPAKAFVIAEIAVRNPTAYEKYKVLIKPIVEKYGGKYLVRAGRVEAIDGKAPTGRVIVLEFPSFAAAEAFEKSPENLDAATIRHKAAKSRLFIVEGAQ